VPERQLAAIKTERVTDTVYQLLREGIVNRTFAPGSRLNVDEIARRLQVSRTPVHEALAVLATDGLVEVQPRRGTFVAEFTLGDYAETLDVRRALEVLACEMACQRVTRADLDALRRLMDEMERSVTEHDDVAMAATTHDARNSAFHHRLVQLAGNRRLTAMYDDLRVHLRIARAHLNATSWLARVPIEAAEHLAILDALEARDVTAMQRALDAHLRRSAASLIEDVSRPEGSAPGSATA
jgi:GntR family transcriptional regulator, rspAB operon transcriptional repressor